MTNVQLDALIAKAKKRSYKKKIENEPHPNSTHGQSKTRMYNVWRMMKDRCYNPKSVSYKYYGERGIIVCPEWLSGFEPFYKWAMANNYSNELQLDRRNVNGNYEPDNCRWATTKEQGNNRRNNRYVTINGKTQTFKQWCIEFKLPPTTGKSRLRLGWDEIRALTTPRQISA
jgi:hypothetical protein